MLEAEISVNGDVFVEGHHVGQLSGFRFTLVGGTDGQDLKAVESAAGKALALEFEARAARLHAAGNNDLALSNDGLLRWLGEPVGRLTASDHIMRPRVVLLADELLSGHAREHVQARIERFINHHIATVLKPLDDLTRAEDLQGIAKGLAYQIAENLGVLFRRDVTEDVKSLDQEGRASMRKYGIRFGAYHVFMPALLKPAPAELITLLWALKNDALGRPGYGDLIPALAAGRTSIVTDNTFERNFYRLAGFRFLGKRAVRIDILERLADIIRPLLQWKPGATNRPEGAYDGRHFVATPSMLSILGATADDMEEILKGLGYRADSVTAEQAAAHLSATAPAPAAPPVAEAAGTEETTAEKMAGDTEETSGQQPATEETASEAIDEADAEEKTEVAVAETEQSDAETVVAEQTSEPVEAAPAESAEVVVQEEKRVLLWRPGGGKPESQNRGNQGAGNRRDPGNQNNRDNRRNDRPGENVQGENRQGERKPGEHKQGDNRGQPRQRTDGRKDGRPAEARGEARGDRPPRQDRPRGDDREQNQNRGPRPDKNAKPQQQRFDSKPPRKEKPVDPDSPFAKLAILKEQMKK